jgi:hypothetical protein
MSASLTSFTNTGTDETTSHKTRPSGRGITFADPMRFVIEEISTSCLVVNSHFRSLPDKFPVLCKYILIRLQTPRVKWRIRFLKEKQSLLNI